MLSVLIGQGLLFACVILLWPKQVYKLSILSILVSFSLFIWLSLQMDFTLHELQLVESYLWVPKLGIQWLIAWDSISWVFCLLTLFIHMVVTLSACAQSLPRLHWYMALFLIMQSMTLGVFMAFDAMLFYMFWEGMLIPMYLCICIWGAESSQKAAMKFFLFTFAGSLLMLFGFLYLGAMAQSFSFIHWVAYPLSFVTQCWLFLLWVPGFSVKVPMFPLHTWLPNAHTQASSEVSVILASLMLKVGAYGFIRIAMPILPDACRYFAPYMVILSLISILYIGILAYSQRDIKQLIAYASISHMGFVTLGLFLIYDAKEVALMAYMGAIVQMITHSFGSGALFLSFGLLYEKVKKRDISLFQGLYTKLPKFSLFFMLFVFSTIGVPATGGFVGEWMVITSSIMIDPKIGLLAVLSVVISAVYLLNLVRQIAFSEPSYAVAELSDISLHQMCILSMFALAILSIGVFPNCLLTILSPSSNALIKLALSSKLGGL